MNIFFCDFVSTRSGFASSFVYIVDRKRVLVVCDKMMLMITELLSLTSKDEDVSSQGCSECGDEHWIGAPTKRVKIHIQQHFVARGCNCGRLFPTTDALRRHRKHCELFLTLYGKTANHFAPIFIVCSCQHARLWEFLRLTGWVDKSSSLPCFPALLPSGKRAEAKQFKNG